MIPSFRIKAGSQFTQALEMVDSNGDAVNITGATVFFICRNINNPDTDDTGDTDTTMLFKYTQATHTNAALGLTTIVLTKEQTLQTPGTYFYEIKIKFSNGDIFITNTGTLTILPRLNNRNS